MKEEEALRILWKRLDGLITTVERNVKNLSDAIHQRDIETSGRLICHITPDILEVYVRIGVISVLEEVEW